MIAHSSAFKTQRAATSAPHNRTLRKSGAKITKITDSQNLQALFLHLFFAYSSRASVVQADPAAHTYLKYTRASRRPTDARKKRGLPARSPPVEYRPALRRYAAYHIGLKPSERASTAFTLPERSFLVEVSSLRIGAPGVKSSDDRSTQNIENSVVKPK